MIGAAVFVLGFAPMTPWLVIQPTSAQSDPFIAEIVMFGGNFAPRGWAFTDGQLLPISQNTALFSILGTTYGGDGQTTFALPDLRGRTAVHPGTGPGLAPVQLGQRFGAETATLSVSNLPAHSHSVNAWTDANPRIFGDTGDPTGAFPAKSWRPEFETGPANTQMNTAMIGSTGGGQSFSIRDPSLGINHIIALEGIYPSRN